MYEGIPSRSDAGIGSPSPRITVNGPATPFTQTTPELRTSPADTFVASTNVDLTRMFPFLILTRGFPKLDAQPAINPVSIAESGKRVSQNASWWSFPHE